MILGGGLLVGAVWPAGLIDELVLLVHPLTLGHGRRLFPDGTAGHDLELADALPTGTGVVIATYRRPR